MQDLYVTIGTVTRGTVQPLGKGNELIGVCQECRVLCTYSHVANFTQRVTMLAMCLPVEANVPKRPSKQFIHPLYMMRWVCDGF